MSSSLVKRSLELFDTPVRGDKSATKESSKKENNVAKKKYKRKSLRGVADVKRSSIKTVEQIRKQIDQQKDWTEENLRRLGVLSKTILKDSEATKMFVRAKRLDKEPEIVKPEETTAFTEEDFAMFEREYFVD